MFNKSKTILKFIHVLQYAYDRPLASTNKCEKRKMNFQMGEMNKKNVKRDQ